MPRISHKKREKEIKIRVNEEEFEQLTIRKTQQSLATWMREIALNATPIYQADPNLVRQIGRIGSNINQIARHANTNKVLDKHVLYRIEVIESLLLQLIASHRNDS